MTIQEFNRLDDYEKNALIFNAEKLTERVDEISKYELFCIDNFFVETRTSLHYKFRRNIKTFTFGKLPFVYASRVSVSS